MVATAHLFQRGSDHAADDLGRDITAADPIRGPKQRRTSTHRPIVLARYRVRGGRRRTVGPRADGSPNRRRRPSHEKLGLPANFADLFFRHGSSSDAEEAPTIEALDEEITRLEKQLADKKAIRDAVLGEIEDQAQREAEKAAALAALAELEKAAAAAAQKVAEARTKLAEMPA